MRQAEASRVKNFRVKPTMPAIKTKIRAGRNNENCGSMASEGKEIMRANTNRRKGGILFNCCHPVEHDQSMAIQRLSGKDRTTEGLHPRPQPLELTARPKSIHICHAAPPQPRAVAGMGP